MNRYIYFAALATLLVLPQSSQAFVPFNQTARVLEKNAAVFTVSYVFSSKKDNLYLPIFGSVNPIKDEFGFRVRANDEPGVYNKAFGFVISSAPVENGMYVIKPGTSATFTAIMVVQASSTDELMQYHTHLNYLPFYQSDRFIPLNKYQLESYVTPKVEL